MRYCQVTRNFFRVLEDFLIGWRATSFPRREEERPGNEFRCRGGDDGMISLPWTNLWILMADFEAKGCFFGNQKNRWNHSEEEYFPWTTHDHQLDLLNVLKGGQKMWQLRDTEHVALNTINNDSTIHENLASQYGVSGPNVVQTCNNQQPWQTKNGGGLDCCGLNELRHGISFIFLIWQNYFLIEGKLKIVVS